MAPTPDKTPAVRPLAEDVPTDLAWKKGRRVYIRCSRTSRLNEDLRAAGARWDHEAKALWVGTAKAERVLPLVRAHTERVRAVADVKALGLYAAIPFDAQEVRARAKELGALWVGERKEWAMRTPEDLAQVRALVQAYLAEQARVRKARQEQEAQIRAQAEQEQREVEQVRREHAEQAAREEAARVVAGSGRTPTGEQAQLRVVSTRRMNKAAAREMAYGVGELVRLEDGRYGVVTGARVWFTGEEAASSLCWHPQTHDQAHWDLLHTVAVVEPTGAERAADAERAERAADAAELHALLRELKGAGQVREGYSDLDPEQVVGTVEHRYGSPASSHDGGTVYLTIQGQVLYRHPGSYDDYRATERTVTDAALVGRVRAALARGERTRTHVEQMGYDYTVRVRRDLETAPAPAAGEGTGDGDGADLAARVEELLAGAGAEHYLVRDRAGRVSVHPGPGWEPTEQAPTAKRQVAIWRGVLNACPEVYADLPRFNGAAVRGAHYLIVQPASAGRELFALLGENADFVLRGWRLRLVAVEADGTLHQMLNQWGNQVEAVRFEVSEWHPQEPDEEVLEAVAALLGSRPGWQVRREGEVVHAQRAEPGAEEGRVRAFVRVGRDGALGGPEVAVALVVHRPGRALVETLRVVAATDHLGRGAYVDVRGAEEYRAHEVAGLGPEAVGQAVDRQAQELVGQGFAEVEPPPRAALWLGGRRSWYGWDPRRT